jgi:transcriptional regulator with GAF, ATPase, and Fis domain
MTALALENAHEVETLETQNALLSERLGTRLGMIGRSAPMERVLKVIERVAPQDVTVLLLGETGTGKELAARALHAASARRDAPFVAINCAALPDHLVESELFGHEKGAFTGAASLKKGKLELASGGTVLLDEIGELPLAMQAKLLRVLQQREFERVGGTRTLPLDIRLVAATNRDLQEETRHGRFREDLFHRLNVVTVRLPSLRERIPDIPELALHFLASSAERFGRKGLRLSESAVQCLSRYHWPGNVRELENAMERAAVLCESDEVMPEDLPEAIVESSLPAGIAGAYQKNVGEAKREAIVRAWGQSGGDYKGAAKLLGIHPNSLLRLVRNLGMRELLG